MIILALRLRGGVMCECRRITLRQVREEGCWDSGHRTVQHGSAEQQTAWGIGGSVITQIVTWRPKQTFYLFDLYLLDLVCQTFFLSLSA